LSFILDGVSENKMKARRKLKNFFEFIYEAIRKGCLEKFFEGGLLSFLIPFNGKVIIINGRDN